MINIEAIKQRNSIYDQIVGTAPATGSGKAKVFSTEAGLGKTTTTIEALRDLNEMDSSCKSLLVVPFTDDAKKIARKLGDIAIALHCSNKKNMDIQAVLEIPILIITHARYKKLCHLRNRKKPEYSCLIRGRSILIIDEEIRIENNYAIDLTDYMKLRNSIEVIDPSLMTEFDNVFREVKEILIKMDKGVVGLHVFNPTPMDEEECIYLRKLKSKVSAKNGDFKFFDYLSIKMSEECGYYLAKNYKELVDALENMEGLKAAQDWFYDGAAIRCASDDTQYVFLDNNIILDASASISPVYNLMPMMEVLPAKRTISCAEWTLNVCSINTSGSNKRRNTQIMRDVAQLIQDICSNPENKLLVIGSAHDVGGKEQKMGRLQQFYPELCVRFKGRLDFVNFAAMRGKNNWADYNCCLVMHTPYRPVYHYALILKTYQPDTNLSDSDFYFRYSVKKGRTVCSHKRLDAMYETMGADVYQGVMRINRRRRGPAQIFLLTSAQGIVQTLVENLPGIQVKELRLPCQRNAGGSQSGKRKEDTQMQVKLKTLLIELEVGRHREHECAGLPGRYKKKWCMAQIGCNGHFSRQLNAVQDEMLRLGIAQDQHKLIVLKHVKD